MKGYSAFPQSSSITEASPSDCLVSYPGHSLGGLDLTHLQRSSLCILQPQPTEEEQQLLIIILIILLIILLIIIILLLLQLLIIIIILLILLLMIIILKNQFKSLVYIKN